MGTLIASSVCGRGGNSRFRLYGGMGRYDTDHSPLCIICAAIFCFTFAMTIFFSLKQEAVLAKCIVIFIVVLSTILLCAACCRNNEKETLPVQHRTKSVVNKENRTLPVQPSRIGFGKANVVAFLKRIFLFSTNSYCPESQKTTKIQSSLPVATYANTTLV